MNPEAHKVTSEICHRHANHLPLYAHYIKKNEPELLATATHVFGGWKQALNAAGIEYGEIRRYKNWTPESIIAEIRALHDQGVDLSFRAMMLGENAALVYAAIRPNRFGSWRKALSAAGLVATDIYRYRSWSDADIINEIKRLATAGADMSSKKMDETHNSLISTARRRFGSWAAALARAGVEYETVRKRRRWSKDKILMEIKRLHEAGHSLSSRSIRENYPSLYSAACKVAFFGSWNLALEAARIPASTRPIAYGLSSPLSPVHLETRSKLRVNNSFLAAVG